MPEQVTTTVPGSSTTDATTTTSIVATSVGRSTTIPGTLPQTGSSGSGPLAAGGLALLGVGIVALAFTRRRTADLGLSEAPWRAGPPGPCHAPW